ncbi:hypothetical protein AHiyo1_21980 [Arthrobacter sp. Hiyo1]|nr:hypothetical protein AHiyo1_21980 [Arthrobacter sp. Hiyo1]
MMQPPSGGSAKRPDARRFLVEYIERDGGAVLGCARSAGLSVARRSSRNHTIDGFTISPRISRKGHAP